MTGEVFTRNIDMLIAGTKQYRSVTPEKKAAYWKVMEQFSDQAFIDACNRLLTTEEEMPSIPRILEEMKRDKPAKPPDCSKCDMGMIRFDFTHTNGLVYEHYAACDKCEAGHACADHMSMMARKRAKSRSLMPPPHDPSPYYWSTIRPRIHKLLVTDDSTPSITGAWDVEEGSETSKNAFLGAIASTRKGKAWDMGDDEREFRKEDD